LPTRLRLQQLEDRCVPSIVYSSSGSRNVADGGGPVLTNVHVDLIFWGAGWQSGVGPALQTNLQNAVDSILASHYFDGLSQYRNIGPGSRIRSDLITTTSPPSTFSQTNVTTFLAQNINNGTLPNPTSDSQLLYVVIAQPGSTSGSVGGAHGTALAGTNRYQFAWSTNQSSGSLDYLTNIVSHEMVESVTDPQVNFRNGFFVPSTSDELCDGEAQNYGYRLGGVLVQSYLSQRDRAYIISTGQVQNFFVSSSRVLSVRGNQLADHDDTIDIDLNGSNRLVVTLNGEAAEFSTGLAAGSDRVSSIGVQTGDGTDTVNVLQTSVATTITGGGGGGSDVVNVGTGGSVQGIRAALTILNPGDSTTVNVDDSADTANHTVTLDTVNLTDGPYGRISGLAPAAIQFKNSDTGGVTVLTGTGTIAVRALAADVPIAVQGGGGVDTLTGPNQDATWQLTGPDSGTLTGSAFAGAVAFGGFGNLTGGSGADAFLFHDGASLSGNLDGGAGSNTLDYSAFSGTVVVDLQTNQATGVGGSVSNLQTLVGGTGGGDAGAYNILVGNGGNVLIGGTGRRNLLIAGAGGSSLQAGDGEDILIGGTTAYDTEAGLASLGAIMQEWSRTDEDYATRLANITTGTGVPLLDATTVTGNGGGNTVVGSGALALVYSDGLDNISGFDPASQVIPITP
jgi:hypothetical protein